MIDEFSLQTLVDISRHDTLSKVMTHLIIGLDELQPYNKQQLQLLNRRPEQWPTVSEFHRWRAAACAQQALLWGGGAVDLLSQALVNLPNLKTIDIRDFNSNTRYRDATPGNQVPPWRSYGSSRYQQWSHQEPWLLSLTSATNFPDTVFMVALTAVSRRSTTVQNLEVILRNGQIGLQDDAFNIFAVPDTRLADGLRGLTKLHLDLCFQPSLHPGFRSAGTPPLYDWFDTLTAYFRHFLALTPNLVWLRLNFADYVGHMPNPHPSRLIEWLALKPDQPAPEDAPWDEVNPAPVALPLQRLDLGQVTTTGATLRRLFKKFADLNRISMRSVWFREPADASDSNQREENDNGDCLWARLIRRLHVTNPKMKQVELRGLEEATPHKDEVIIFRDKDNPLLCGNEVNTRIVDTTTLEQLADNTWTGSRWQKFEHEHLMDEDSVDEDSMDDDMDDEE